MLDTNEDIKRRKFLARNAANRIQAIFDNEKFTPETKMSAFRAYIESIFLHNCKIWTVTSSQAENIINAFQRMLLRTYVLNEKLPNTVRNEEVYRKTRPIEWSTTIQKKRLAWF